jgi:hypothetical protein
MVESLRVHFGFLIRCDVGDCGEARIMWELGGYTGMSKLQLIAAGLRTPSKRAILAGRSYVLLISIFIKGVKW